MLKSFTTACRTAFILLLNASCLFSQAMIFLEAESFPEKGGWVVDQQFMDQMGSPYLLAHGLGMPVKDAATTASVRKNGNYFLWVRTKDWAPFPRGPGRFRIGVNGTLLDTVFGASGLAAWKWYPGGRIPLAAGPVRISLRDLAGFEGRVDAVLLTDKKDFRPPDEPQTLKTFRRKALGLPDTPPDAGTYDLAVVGGGIAGICAAVSAARLGLSVVLVHDRPALGGNNSSEIRVHLMGDLDTNAFPKLGRIVRELDNGDPGNAAPEPEAYGDDRKREVVEAEKNIALFLKWHMTGVETMDGRITALLARHIESGEEKHFSASWFVDCTGDASIGFLAGADWRMGRESRSETGESMAADGPDRFTMGSSNLWYAVQEDRPSAFPECNWALPFSDAYHLDETRADWRWETGYGNFDPVLEAEALRDHNFRAVYGNWSYLKNRRSGKYADWRLAWLAYVAGKRESRRLLGDVVLTQQDIQERKPFPDACVTTTWNLDLHVPDSTNSRFFPGREFYSGYVHPEIEPYTIPYRCLYSRNIENLFMAGRNISVTHVALGTVRVMRTGGMMGEVVGMAAFLCKKHRTTPRGIYERHLDELMRLLSD